MYQVLKKQKIGHDIYELEIEAKHIVKYAAPGNFVIIRIDKNGERTPFTIADFTGNSIIIVFKVKGKTTELLSKMRKGNFISDVAGPLGNDAGIDEFGSVLIAAGGIGCASTYLLAKKLKEIGNNVINIIGASNKDKLIWPEKFEEVSDKLIICTEDGSYGEKCLVTKQIENIVRSQHFNRVIVVGPPEMMKEAARLTHLRAKTVAHLSPIMMDGIGMCGGCRVSVGGVTKFACLDGPEFDAHKVDFDSLIYRNSRFNHHANHSSKNHENCLKKSGKNLIKGKKRKKR